MALQVSLSVADCDDYISVNELRSTRGIHYVRKEFCSQDCLEENVFALKKKINFK